MFSAIALNAIAMTLSLILGPVLIKVVGDQFGFDGAFWFQAGFLLLGAAFLTRVDVPDHEEDRDRRPILTETREAVRHILDDNHLTTLFGLTPQFLAGHRPRRSHGSLRWVPDRHDQGVIQANPPQPLMGRVMALYTPTDSFRLAH
jgi:hypothetical protein